MEYGQKAANLSVASTHTKTHSMIRPSGLTFPRIVSESAYQTEGLCLPPCTVTFYHTMNPYIHDPGTPDFDGRSLSHNQTPTSFQQHSQWNTDLDPRSRSPDLHSHGLEALSAAALYSPPKANMMPRPMSMNGREVEIPYGPVTPSTEHAAPAVSPPTPMSSSNNLNYILNPSSATDSPLDPSLMSPHDQQLPPIANATSTAQNGIGEARQDGEAESEHKVAFLLRHFSESPGQWLVNQNAYGNEGS